MLNLFERLFLINLFLSSINAFYLPGLAPNVYCRTAGVDSKCKVRLIEYVPFFFF